MEAATYLNKGDVLVIIMIQTNQTNPVSAYND